MIWKTVSQVGIAPFVVIAKMFRFTTQNVRQATVKGRRWDTNAIGSKMNMNYCICPCIYGRHCRRCVSLFAPAKYESSAENRSTFWRGASFRSVKKDRLQFISLSFLPSTHTLYNYTNNTNVTNIKRDHYYYYHLIFNFTFDFLLSFSRSLPKTYYYYYLPRT